MADKSASDKAGYSYDLFFRGPEGYGEHFQVFGDDTKILLEGRTSLINALGIMDAKPLPRDMENQGRAPRSAPPSRPAPAPGTTPICDLDGGVMELRNGRNGAFYGCVNYRTTGCRGTRPA